MAPKKTRLALAAALAAFSYAGLHGKLRRYEIAESSMQPSLQPGDYVIAQARTGTVERGHVVIIARRDGLELVKRVVGLPLETVTISNGQVNLNGALLAEPWADGPTRPDGEWQTGTNEIFVLGDNRALSISDSRVIGPVPLDKAAWRVVARYWPPAGVGRI
ncbi:MAG: signal peptidase I [bacterium]|nr:signal peptidase I [bacterium]MCP4968355.1 signal peptidase I [bacterium]